MKNTNGLKKAGIEIVKELSIFEINKIALIISNIICNSFSEHNLDKSDLFASLSRVKMYLAKFLDNSAAKYCYKTNTIYFNENLDYRNIKAPEIHECLHFIQTVKNKNGRLVKLGLYNPTILKQSGFALNEAAVQLMASEAVSAQEDSVKYYDLDVITISPNYYPIECALVKQMTYFTGTYPLYHSTLYSDDIFKNTFIMKSDEKTYYNILSNLDLIVNREETLNREILYLSFIEYNAQNSSRVLNLQKTVEKLKKDIKDLSIETQELILTACTKSELNMVRDFQGIKEFKDKLYKFKEILIQTDDYEFYNDFYCQMMEELDKKRELIEKYGPINCFTNIEESSALVETRKEPLNLFKVAIEKIKQLFKVNQTEKVNDEDK